MLLELIKKPNDIKKIDPKDYNKLAEEIRQFARKYIDYEMLSCCLIGDTRRVAEPLKKRIL